MWDWEEPSWDPGIQTLTITTTSSDAEMLNWQNVIVKHLIQIPRLMTPSAALWASQKPHKGNDDY